VTARTREPFLLDPGIVFLNHGSFGARPRVVLEAQEKLRRELEANPVEFLARRSGALLDGALSRLGAFLRSDPEDLAFITNASAGVAIAAASVRLGRGDEVLGTDHEYGAAERTWRQAAAHSGASYRAVQIPFPWRGKADFLSRMEDAITKDTRVLFASHVTSPTAIRFPVEELVALARSRGLVSVIDGAHAPALVDADLSSIGADYYMGNCHKWMCAPPGAAFIRVDRGRHAEVEPPIAGWGMLAEESGSRDHDSYAGTTPLQRRLRWLGTRDPTPWLAVPAAIDFLEGADWAGARPQRAALARSTVEKAAALLGPALPDLGFDLPMRTLSLPECDPIALKELLFGRFGIEVPVIVFGGRQYLRLSFHLYNDESDASALLEALGECFPGGRPLPDISGERP